MILMRILGLTLDGTDKRPILVLRQTNPPNGADALVPVSYTHLTLPTI